MHIRDDRAYKLCDNLYPLILQSDCFIGEMDLDMSGSETQIPRYDLQHYFKDKTYQKMQRQIKKSYQVDLDHFSHLHPLMIMSILSTSVLESEHQVSLDEHLWKYAKDHGKKTIGLESYEEQLQILHSIEPCLIYKQLLKISRKPSTIRKSSSHSVDLYLQGRIHKLYLLSKSSMQQLRKKVIYERNRKMVSVINHLDSTTQNFITVGAGHLSGKFGLLSLLKKSGWKIHPHRIFSKA